MGSRKVAELSQRRRVGIWSFDFWLQLLLSSGRCSLLLLHLLLLLLCLLLCFSLALLFGQLSVALFALSRKLRIGSWFELQVGSGT